MATATADTPMADTARNVRPVPEGYTEVREGKAAILQRANDVFFNPVQVINRDMSIAVLKYFVQQRQEELASGKLRLKRRPKGPHALPADGGVAATGDAGEAAPPAEAEAPAGAAGEGARPAEAEPTVATAGEGAPLQAEAPTNGAGDGAGPAPPQEGEAQAAAGIRVLEGLAASGLRAIRYAAEVEGVAEVVANDLDPNVVAAMRQNIEWSGLGEGVARVVPTVGDARLVALQNPGGFEAVDLDPYGSPAQLLDSAVQAVSEGGLLLATATDMATLCGNNGEACFAKYGSYPLHKPYCHEMALRILLASLATHAARYKRYIVPVLSLSIDFYIRIFVRVYTSAAEVKAGATKLGYVWQSQGCDSFYWQRVGRRSQRQGSNAWKYTPGHGPAVPQACPETGGAFVMGGPFWAEPIHDQEWVVGILKLIRSQKSSFPAYERIHSILTGVSEELPDVPLYFDLHSVCKTLHCTPPRADVLRSALVNAGHRVSGTHACPLGVKTDAPWSTVWDILRCWVADHPTKTPAPGTAKEKILSKQPEIKANFSRAAQALSRAKQAGVTRFLPNPQANWGPKPKHRKGGANVAQQQQGEQQAGGEAAAAVGQQQQQQNGSAE
eukprot:scaffold1.g5640.t1